MLEPLLAAESVPVPDQLRNPDGVTKLRQLLKDEFGISRQHQLHCLKLACRWPDYRTAYADLLGVLTAFKDVEALGCQWQGQKNNIHNPDRVPNQVSAQLRLTCKVGLNCTTAAFQCAHAD